MRIVSLLECPLSRRQKSGSHELNILASIAIDKCMRERARSVGVPIPLVDDYHFDDLEDIRE